MTAGARVFQRFDADSFIRFAGWDGIEPTEKRNIGTALEFFQLRIPFRILANPSADAEPFTGRTRTRLEQYMQCINFEKPVRIVTLLKGQKLKCYERPLQAEEAALGGNFFTDPGVPWHILALPSDQTNRFDIEVVRPIQALCAFVGDARTWSRSRQQLMLHGGGIQYFIYFGSDESQQAMKFLQIASSGRLEK
jgi:hypothetical protein